jgi:hypothetical protein
MSIPEYLLLPASREPAENVLLSVRLEEVPAVQAREVSLEHLLGVVVHGGRMLMVNEYPCVIIKMTVDFAQGRARLDLRRDPA